MKLLIISTLLFTHFALATGGHFHPKKVAQCASSCTEDQIKAAVPAAVKELANWKKLDIKWETAKIESATKKDFKKANKSLTAWVVTLADEKNKVYLYFTTDGEIFRTNTTGELK